MRGDDAVVMIDVMIDDLSSPHTTCALASRNTILTMSILSYLCR